MSWSPLTAASTRETDDRICDLIGLSRDTYRDSSYLRQGDGGYADPDRDPRQRKQLLVEAVLGRDPIWPRLTETAKARRRESETRIERLTGEAQLLREQTAGAEEAEQQEKAAADAVLGAAAALSDAERRHADVVEEIARGRERLAARQAALAELNVAQQALARLEERQAEADRCAVDIADTWDAFVTLATPEQLAELEAEEIGVSEAFAAATAAHADYGRLQQEQRLTLDRLQDIGKRATEATAAAAKLRQQADEVLASSGTELCDRCGQALGVEAAVHAAASYRVEADRFAATAANLTDEARAITIPESPSRPTEPPDPTELADLRRRVATARTQQQERARYEERLTQLTRTVADRPSPEELAAARANVTEKRVTLDALPDTANPVLDDTLTAAAVADARHRREQAVAAQARITERVAQISQARTRLTTIETETSEIQAAIDRDLLLEKAYGRDGIPALILENTAIPSIEAEASRILRALGTGFDVQLRTQAETKTGGLRDTLDVVVIDPDGNEADYADGCSGGEQTRIGLALRIALARLLANRRGAESRLLALDEPSYLDAAGMTALLHVLRGLETEFDTILLVSHVAELRDALDDTILVVKEAGVSRIDGAPVVEAVAA